LNASKPLRILKRIASDERLLQTASSIQTNNIVSLKTDKQEKARIDVKQQEEEQGHREFDDFKRQLRE